MHLLYKKHWVKGHSIILKKGQYGSLNMYLVVMEVWVRHLETRIHWADYAALHWRDEIPDTVSKISCSSVYIQWRSNTVTLKTEGLIDEEKKTLFGKLLEVSFWNKLESSFNSKSFCFVQHQLALLTV